MSRGRLSYLPEAANVAFDVAGDTLVYKKISIAEAELESGLLYQSVAVASISDSYSWLVPVMNITSEDCMNP